MFERPKDTKVTPDANPENKADAKSLEEKKQTRDEIAKHLISHAPTHASILSELKRRQKTDEKSRPKLKSSDADAKIYGESTHKATTPSEIHLEQFVGPKGTWREKVQRFIKLPFHKEDKCFDSDFENLMVKALADEKLAFEQGLFSLYHGANHMKGIMYDLFTEMQRLIHVQDNPHYHRLRLSEVPFFSINTMDQFLEYYTGNHLTDVQPEYTDMGICVNTFLFGNYGAPSEATYLYVAKDHATTGSRPFLKEGMLYESLVEIGLDEKEIEIILDKLTQLATILRQSGGRLYQTNVRQDMVDKISFPASGGGFVLYPDHRDPTKLPSLKKYYDETLKTKTADNTLQARFVMLPDVIDELDHVKTNSYSHHALSAQDQAKYTKELQEIAQMLCHTILVRQTDKQLLATSKPLTMVYRSMASQASQEDISADPEVYLQKIMQSKQFRKLQHLYKRWPEYNNFEKIAKFISPEHMKLNVVDLVNLLTYIPQDKHSVVLDRFANDLHLIIKNQANLNSVLERLAKHEHANLIIHLTAQLPEIVNDHHSFLEIAKLVPEGEKLNAIIMSFKDKITNIIPTELFIYCIEQLPPSARSSLIQCIGDDRMPAFIDKSQMSSLLSHVDSQLHEQLLKCVNAKFVSFDSSSSELVAHFEIQRASGGRRPYKCSIEVGSLANFEKFLALSSDPEAAIKQYPQEQFKHFFVKSAVTEAETESKSRFGRPS